MGSRVASGGPLLSSWTCRLQMRAWYTVSRDIRSAVSLSAHFRKMVVVIVRFPRLGAKEAGVAGCWVEGHRLSPCEIVAPFPALLPFGVQLEHVFASRRGASGSVRVVISDRSLPGAS